MDILNTTSIDIPYEDTNYIGSLTSPLLWVNIKCTKVSTKRYEDSTYFKLELPLGMVLTTNDDITLNLDRDDSCRLILNVKVTNNIIRIDTVKIHWVKVEIKDPSKPFVPSKDFSEELRRLQNPTESLFPRETWQSDRTIMLPDIGYEHTNQPIRFISSNNTISSSITGNLRSDLDGDNAHSAAFDINNPF